MDFSKIYMQTIENLQDFGDNPELTKLSEYLKQAQLFAMDPKTPQIDVEAAELERYLKSGQFHLPFPVIAMQTVNVDPKTGQELSALILGIDNGPSINVSLFVKHPDLEAIVPCPITIQYNKPIDDFDYGRLMPFDGVTEEEMKFMYESLVGSFSMIIYLAWLISHRVKIDICPANPKLNKKRKKKGRMEYPDVRMLAVNRIYTSYNSEGHGGHHASPRTHTRRGFFRTRNGKVHWVKSTVVNPDYNEKIQKIYVIERPNIKE